ncbi:hypothetical protein BMF94_2009 [Rhodotorula taiwanensis]|uniref:Histone H1 n=1 Tax=Rhodotorula taiwanensis TaxID=741276 RepID=A0A2S5BE52_9BASI|nr:hypothetical protein BMF94_2009 [Rhodotorula taiwanensis]
MTKTSKKAAQHRPWIEMLDQAIHSAKGEKISRKKIYSYLEDNWRIDMTNEQRKAYFKQALEKRMKEKRIEQDKQSFFFTPLGTKAYTEEYESSEEEDPEEDAKPVKSKKMEEANGGAARKKQASK